MGVIHNYNNKLKNHKRYIAGRGLVNVHYKKHVKGKGITDTFLNLVNNPYSKQVIKDVVDIGIKVNDLKNTINDLKALKISKIKKDIKTGKGFKYI